MLVLSRFGGKGFPVWIGIRQPSSCPNPVFVDAVMHMARHDDMEKTLHLA